MGEAFGVERAAFHGKAHLLPAVAGKEVELRRIAVAVLGLQLQRAARGPRRDHVDDAAHRDVAVEARGRVFGDLDLLHAQQRHARPVHPAAKRIVEGDAVEQHERAALAARTDAAQRHALGGGLRGQAAGATEQTEAWHLAQDVVSHDRWRGLDGLARHHVHAGRHGAEPPLRARRADDHGLEHRRRREHDFQVAGGHGLSRIGKTRGAHHEHRALGGRRGDREATLAIGHRLLQSARRRAYRHRGAHDDLPGGVLHHAGDACGRLRQCKEKCQDHRNTPFLAIRSQYTALLWADLARRGDAP